jgi:hypothetical protein
VPTFQINDSEWETLVEEPGDIFLVYCSIRRFMDYRTGVSGLTRRISEQMISEVLYVTPTRGRHESGSPTRQRIRSVIERLVKLGALVTVGPMVYELPLASRDRPSKPSATEQQPHEQPYQQPSCVGNKPSNDKGLSGKEQDSTTGSESDTPLNSNLPPISGKDIPPPSPRTCANDSRTKFAMTADWEPNPQTFKATLTMNAMAGVQIQPDQLLEFRSFWIANPDEHRTQARWEHALAQHLKREHRHAQSNPGRTYQAQAGAYAGGGRKLSAVDRVKQSIADRKAREAAAGAAGQALDEDGGDVRPPLDVEFWRES